MGYISSFCMRETRIHYLLDQLCYLVGWCVTEGWRLWLHSNGILYYFWRIDRRKEMTCRWIWLIRRHNRCVSVSCPIRSVFRFRCYRQGYETTTRQRMTPFLRRTISVAAALVRFSLSLDTANIRPFLSCFSSSFRRFRYPDRRLCPFIFS